VVTAVPMLLLRLTHASQSQWFPRPILAQPDPISCSMLPQRCHPVAEAEVVMYTSIQL
jgi:hypothetical protein